MEMPEEYQEYADSFNEPQGNQKQNIDNEEKEEQEALAKLAEFDKMFQVWEVNFYSWKEANRFNPDKIFVNNYVREMEMMREELLRKRQVIFEQVTKKQKQLDAMKNAWNSQQTFQTEVK